MTTPCKIPCSPAMREFNDAVEVGDGLSWDKTDRAVNELAGLLWDCGYHNEAYRILVAREKLSAQERAQFQ